MYDSISAPNSIDPMVTKLNTLAVAINDEMAALGTAYKRLLASGATGAAVDALGVTLRTWQNRGLGESDRTRGVATASSNYKQDIDTMDASFATRFV